MFLEKRLSHPKQAHSNAALFWISSVMYGGGVPSAPPPPDYAAANRAGVLADVQTLASRREIDIAARTGGSALIFGAEERTRPITKSGYVREKNGTYTQTVDQVKKGFTEIDGKYYKTYTQKDATSKGQLKPNFEKTSDGTYYYTKTSYGAKDAVARVKKTVPESEATTGEKYYVQLFNDKGERLKTPKEISQQEAVVDFAGKSDIDAAKAMADFQKGQADAIASSLLDIQNKYGTQFAESARNQLRALDPTGFDLREQLAKESKDTVFEKIQADPEFRNFVSSPSLEMTFDDGPDLTRINSGPEFGNLSSGSTMERIGSGPQFGLQNYGPEFALGSEFEGGGSAAMGRAEVERQLGEQLLNEGKLSVDEERRLNNSVRGGQVARGNTYGNAPLAQEILARFGAETERARQARADVVGYLSSGQSSFDVAKAIRQEANQLAQQGYINYSTALGVNNNLAQREFENQISAIGQRNAASQTELDNVNKAIMGDNQALQQAYENYKSSVGANNAMSLTEYQNSINAVASRNQTRQQDYANQNAAIQYQNQMSQLGYQNQLNNITQRNQATQQRFANMQTFAGLSPIVNQGGQLQGLQQQAAPFMQTPVPQGIGLNPNAGQLGTQFALGVYDNQTRQYQSQMQYASQNSPLQWISAIGGLNPFSFKF